MYDFTIMLELTKRAEMILKRPAAYTTPPSTVHRVFEMYNSIPTPVYAEPSAPPPRKGKM